ncbi:MAG TPA: hypothetical protein VFS89_09430, partial [Nitrosospira sp.]|nr:hypothetical protein [Nitrosospira sp.]
LVIVGVGTINIVATSTAGTTNIVPTSTLHTHNPVKTIPVDSPSQAVWGICRSLTPRAFHSGLLAKHTSFIQWFAKPMNFFQRANED